jgi:hypothetical protein
MKLTSITTLLAIWFLTFVWPAFPQDPFDQVLLIYDRNAILKICPPISLGCATRIDFGGDQSYLVDPLGPATEKLLQEIIDRLRAASLLESAPGQVAGFFVEEKGHFPNPTATVKVFKLLHAEFPLPELQNVDVYGVLRNPSKPHKKIGICSAWLDEGYVRVEADANNLKKKHVYSALLTLTIDGFDETKHLDATIAGDTTHTFRYKEASVTVPKHIKVEIREHEKVNAKTDTDEEIIRKITTHDVGCDDNCAIIGECNMEIVVIP